MVGEDVVAIVGHVEGLNHDGVVEPCSSGKRRSGSLVAREASRCVDCVLLRLSPNESGLLGRNSHRSEGKGRCNLQPGIRRKRLKGNERRRRLELV